MADIIGNEAGQCPYCNSELISYGGTELQGNQLAYQCTCDTCGKKFKEWYTLEFTETRGNE